jgi:hypothetical protein
MKAMTVNEAIKLVKSNTSPAISIYLKTDHKDRDGTNKVRANLTAMYKTIEGLVRRTYEIRHKDRLLAPLKRALAGLQLSQAKGGIAIYHNEHFTGLVKLPTLHADLAVAAESFHLKPVLKCAQQQRNVTAFANLIMDRHVSTTDESPVSMFQKAEASGLASHDLIDIAQAAARGQIQTLFVAEDRHIWGYLDREFGAVEVLRQKHDATSDDLLDDIAELTLLKGGKVKVLPSDQMPNELPIAAIYRWSYVPQTSDSQLVLDLRSSAHTYLRSA